jgi:integrase
VTLIKRIYNLAIRDDMVEKNPCWKVPMLPERNVRDRIVSPEEFEILKNQLPQYALILSLGYYLAMREGEILHLKGKQIHFFGNGVDEGYIELYDDETKTGEGRMVPFGGLMGRLLSDYLTMQGNRNPGGFLFSTEKGNLLGNFRRSFQRACKRAGIKGLCFHDFRHTAITNMRKAEVNISVIMAISGHKTMAMFRRYNRIDLNDGREAMRKLDVYLMGRSECDEIELH